MKFDKSSFIQLFYRLDTIVYLWSSSPRCRIALREWQVFRKSLIKSAAISDEEYVQLQNWFKNHHKAMDIAEREAFVAAYIPQSLQSLFRGLFRSSPTYWNTTPNDAGYYANECICFLIAYKEMMQGKKTIVSRNIPVDRYA